MKLRDQGMFEQFGDGGVRRQVRFVHVLSQMSHLN